MVSGPLAIGSVLSAVIALGMFYSFIPTGSNRIIFSGAFAVLFMILLIMAFMSKPKYVPSAPKNLPGVPTPKHDSKKKTPPPPKQPAGAAPKQPSGAPIDHDNWEGMNLNP